MASSITLASLDTEASITKNKKNEANNEEKKSGIFFTAVNISNSIIGAGIITLPFAFAQSGFGLGVIFLSIIIIFTHFSLVSIAKVMEVTQEFTYQDIMAITFGPTGFVLMTICQFLYPLFAVFSYGIVIIGTLQEIFKYFVPHIAIFQNRAFILFIPMYLIILPLSSFKNISFLDKTSLLSVLLVLYYSLCIVVESGRLSKQTMIFPGFMSFVHKGLAESISIMTFCFSCQQVIPAMYRSLDNRSIVRFSKSINFSLIAVSTFNGLVGVFGYFCFSGYVNPNLFTDFCETSTLPLTARIAFIIAILLTSPIQLFAAREALTTPIYNKYGFKWWIHFLVTISLCTLCYIVSVCVTNLSVIVSFAGSLVGVPICFIFPSLMMLIIMKQGWKPNTLTKCFCYVVLIYGLLACITGAIMSFLNIEEVTTVKYWCNESIISKPFLSRQEIENYISNSWNSTYHIQH